MLPTAPPSAEPPLEPELLLDPEPPLPEPPLDPDPPLDPPPPLAPELVEAPELEAEPPPKLPELVPPPLLELPELASASEPLELLDLSPHATAIKARHMANRTSAGKRRASGLRRFPQARPTGPRRPRGR